MSAPMSALTGAPTSALTRALTGGTLAIFRRERIDDGVRNCVAFARCVHL